MRCLLLSFNLHSKFCEDALLHACWLYNRTPHQSLNCTPIEKLTGRKPDLSHLHAFGSRVIVRPPGGRSTKLDMRAYQGIFLRYSGTDKNIIYYDIASGREKLAHHVAFDETHSTEPESYRPPMSHGLLAGLTPHSPSTHLFGRGC